MAALLRLVGPGLSCVDTCKGFLPYLHLLPSLRVVKLAAEHRLDVSPLQALPRLSELYLMRGTCDQIILGTQDLTRLKKLHFQQCTSRSAELPAALTALTLEQNHVLGDFRFPVAAALQRFTGRLRSLHLGTYIEQLDSDLRAVCALPCLAQLTHLGLTLTYSCCSEPCRPALPRLRSLRVQMHNWDGQGHPSWDFALCTRLQQVHLDCELCEAAVDLRGIRNVLARSVCFTFAAYDRQGADFKDFACELSFLGWQTQCVDVEAYYWGHGTCSSVMVPDTTLRAASNTLGTALALLPGLTRLCLNDRVLDNVRWRNQGQVET